MFCKKCRTAEEQRDAAVKRLNAAGKRALDAAIGPKVKLCNARIFVLRRIEDETGVSGTGIVAEGTEYSNGKVTMTWYSHMGAVSTYDSIKVVQALHGHGGKTVIEWVS